MLDGPGVLTVIGELEAGGMAKHVGVDRHAELRRVAGSGEQLAKSGGRHR